MFHVDIVGSLRRSVHLTLNFFVRMKVFNLKRKKLFYFSSFLQRAKTFSKLAMEIFSQINVFTEFKSRYLRALQILIYILN